MGGEGRVEVGAQVENLLVLLDLGLSRGCLTEMKLKIGMLCYAGNCRCSAPTKYESRFLPLDIVHSTKVPQPNNSDELLCPFPLKSALVLSKKHILTFNFLPKTWASEGLV